MKLLGDIVWSVVDEVLGAEPDPDDSEGKELARSEDIAARERYIAITDRVDDLRFDLNELDEADGDPNIVDRDELIRKIETLNRERRDLAGGHSGQGETR